MIDRDIFPYRTARLAALFGLLVLSLILAWISSDFSNLDGWLSFFGVGLLAGGMLLGAWKLLARSEQGDLPGWLAGLLVGAFLLRLGLGIFWFTALPRIGHPTPVEQGGYVMADAYRRDDGAWQLAQSEEPLWNAFRNQADIDQYGGLLFLSSLIYRYLGGAQHLPLLIVLLAAAASALSVPFLWVLIRRTWSPAAADLAAWGMVVYPEAALLGSSQMREAFSVTLVAVAFYGLLLILRRRLWMGLAWLGGAILALEVLSPPMTTLLFGMLALVVLAQFRKRSVRWLRSPWMWAAASALAALILTGLWLASRQFAPAGVTNPVEQVLYWLQLAAGDQFLQAQAGSAVVSRLFESTPTWMHAPLLIAYGILQPFLPAALLTGSEAPIWQGIAIWRSTGWAVLLVLLVYASLRSILAPNGNHFARAWSLGAWLIIFFAAFRGGGDQWDNPRYRATFAALQIGLAAWAVYEQRRSPDPWLRRLLLMGAALLAPFAFWYLGRSQLIGWPIRDILRTIGLGLSTAGIMVLWDWARTNREGLPPAEPPQNNHDHS